LDETLATSNTNSESTESVYAVSMAPMLMVVWAVRVSAANKDHKKSSGFFFIMVRLRYKR